MVHFLAFVALVAYAIQLILAGALALCRDAGRDALDEDGVSHAPGTLPELTGGRDRSARGAGV